MVRKAVIHFNYALTNIARNSVILDPLTTIKRNWKTITQT